MYPSFFLNEIECKISFEQKLHEATINSKETVEEEKPDFTIPNGLTSWAKL